YFFFQAEDGIRGFHVTGVQTCALPILDGLLGREFDVGLSFGPSEGYGGETPGIVSKLISTGEMVYIDTPGRSPSLNGMPMKLAKIGRASCRERGERAAYACGERTGTQ